MKDRVLVIATTSTGWQTNFLALTTINRCCCWAHRWHRGLRPTRRPVLRLRLALRLRPASRPALPRGAEPVYNRKQRGNDFLTNSGLLDWWSQRWMTAI